MREITIGKNDAGQRLDRFVSKSLPLLPPALLQKYIRLKRIKCNGARAQRDTRLEAGDLLQLYINDEFFDTPREDNAYLTVAAPKLNIVYEDENILLIDKKPGLIVHPDENYHFDSALARIQHYLYEKGEYNPELENSFAPALVNRIDRNTGGIVITAKTAEALRILNQKMKDRELIKLYLCIAVGNFEKKADTMTAYLEKNEKQNRVYISNKPRDGAKTIKTKYRVLSEGNGLSLVEVDLLTGRTHQIRAHMAYIGHPLLGDSKYGKNEYNRKSGYKYQALYSYKLVFKFTTDAGCLEYLNGKSFEVKNIWFLNEFNEL